MVTIHPRVAAALDDRAAPERSATKTSGQLPPLPESINSESAVEWLEHTIELMDPQSDYRKQLRSILERHRFRELRRRA